jgi:hypothetical protein
VTTIVNLKHSGYTFLLMVYAVPGPISRLNIVRRYEEQRLKFGIARWTPIEIHDQAFNNLYTNVSIFENETPIDRIIVFSQDFKIFYSQEKNAKVCSINDVDNDPNNAGDTLINEQRRPLSAVDYRYMGETIEFIRTQMYKRGAVEEFESLFSILMTEQVKQELQVQSGDSKGFKLP